MANSPDGATGRLFSEAQAQVLGSAVKSSFQHFWDPGMKKKLRESFINMFFFILF